MNVQRKRFIFSFTYDVHVTENKQKFEMLAACNQIPIVMLFDIYIHVSYVRESKRLSSILPFFDAYTHMICQLECLTFKKSHLQFSPISMLLK